MNSRNSILLCACLFVATVVLAETPASVTITPSTSNTFTVIYKTPETGVVKLSIYDRYNRRVFKEVISNVASFTRPYNFSALEAGEYTIVLEDKNGRHEEKISHKTSQIVSIVKVSPLKSETDKFVLNVVNNGTEEVYIRIFDDVKGLIYTQNVTVTGSYGLVYNLSQVRSTPTSAITFEVVTAGGKTETVTF